MERSEPDDGAWEDPFGPDSGMWSSAGEPEYTPAPLPAHERRWRHPSELGQEAWVQSERSVGVGRGLLVTSGAIGCILGLAVVWMMVPGPGGAPTAGPNATRSDLAISTTLSFGFAPTSALAAITTTPTAAPTLPTTVATVLATVFPVAVAASLPAETAPPPSTAATLQLPAEDLPTNTVWLKSDAEGATAAVAVLVGDSPYMITTATAVGAVDSVRVMLASGGVTDAPVVAVDEDFAYIEPDESLLTFGFARSAVAGEGDSLTVLADEQFVFTFGDDTLAGIAAAAVAEGTPVVNEDGALVGLCTGASGTVELIPIAGALPDTPVEDTPSETDGSGVDTAPPVSVTDASTTLPGTTVPSTTTTSTVPTTTTVVTTTTVAPAAAKSPWIGIRLGGAGAAPLSITSVSPGSPAEAAGLVVGDEIVAIDDVAVTNVDEVRARVESHAPGDTVIFTVASGSDRAERDVSVVLGEHSL